MSKSTSAVILPSVASLGPWGDQGWRFSGAMQVVEDGPDFLYAQWPTLDGDEHHGVARFASLTLRDEPSDRAGDIAVMTFALLQVHGWNQLHGWWDGIERRDDLRKVMQEIARSHAGLFKLAVVETRAGAIRPAVIESLRALGFESTLFTSRA